MSQMKREDEHLLKELTQRAEDLGRRGMPEDELLMLSLLEDRYGKFLEEGLKKLRLAGTPNASSSPRSRNEKKGIRGLLTSIGLSSPKDGANTNASLNSTKRDANSSIASDGASDRSTDGSPAAVPQSPNSECCASEQEYSGNHWSWVGDNLIVGAIPFAAPSKETSGHLSQLNEEAFRRKCCIAAVVSCLEPDEGIPAGFATTKEWEQFHNTNMFVQASLPRNANQRIEDSTLEFMLSVCQSLHQAVGATPTPEHREKRRLTIVRRVERRPVAYIHCKGGIQRCWVVAMCYLIACQHKTFEEAEDVMRAARPRCDPSAEQQDFVHRFVTYVASPQVHCKSEDEERYLHALAEVLSLPAPLRTRLVRDLEKLT